MEVLEFLSEGLLHPAKAGWNAPMNTNKALETYIEYLRLNQPEHLKWVLYRLDVDEIQLQLELTSLEEQTRAQHIAQRMLQRAQSILESRKQYSSGNNDLSFDVY
ncbi:MAG: hypothetical protein KTR13_02010 [Saprospiraceae bacterium]|nr:hypothetical protein [Saprospiraceae bacterium]